MRRAVWSMFRIDVRVDALAHSHLATPTKVPPPRATQTNYTKTPGAKPVRYTRTYTLAPS